MVRLKTVLHLCGVLLKCSFHSVIKCELLFSLCKEAIMIENYNMNKDAFDFIYNAEGDCYGLVVDKKYRKS